MTPKWVFCAEEGYFQDISAKPHQTPHEKVTTRPALGLLPQASASDGKDFPSRGDWRWFATHVRTLNESSPDDVSYKVLYLTRHGFGYHNQKNQDVGNDAWDTKWSFMDGDEKSTWFDSFLNEKGIQQVKELGELWSGFVQRDGIPLPETIYTSPLARCLQTSQYVFSLVVEAHGQKFRPIIKEKLRERYTLHTCDMRRPKSWIRDKFPGYAIEEGFAEDDPFRPLEKEETLDEHQQRKQELLEDLFSHDKGEFMALTVHSYAIGAILRACHVTEIHVREGSTIALLVKGQRQ